MNNPVQNHQSPFARRNLAIFLATLCGILWGSAYPGIKSGYELFQIGVDDTAAKLLFAGIRFTLAGTLVLVWHLISSRTFGKTSHPQTSTNQSWLKILGGIFFLGLMQTSVHYTFFYLGLSRTPGAIGSIVNSTGVFFSALLAHIIYHNDKLAFGKILGIIVGFIGVIAVNISADLRFTFHPLGEGFIIIAAFMMAASSLYGRKLTRTLAPALVTGGQLFLGGLTLTAVGILGGAQGLQGGFSAWLVLGYLASLSAIAFTLWTTLLKHNKVSSITVFNFVIPISGTLLSALVLGESILEIRYLIALPAVALGVYLVNRDYMETDN